MNYYNEWDKGAAAWLRELIRAGHIPPGDVDERSITEVTASDLAGYTQCHFFAGIGGWSYALALAGVPATTRLWTGSPPCQPFSVAGKQLGQLDERHLAPTFMRLVAQCKPAILFGEQVAAAIGKHWLDDLFTELEAEGYACGAAVLPAASVGAPHKRDRLFFGAVAHDGMQQRQVAYARCCTGRPLSRERQQAAVQIAGCRGNSCMADADDTRPQGRVGVLERANQQPAGASGLAGGLDNTGAFGRNAWQFGNNGGYDGQQPAAAGKNGGAGALNGFWSNADWLGCRDGKFRPVEPGTFPLAHGIPARVGRLRGYGNAIVPQVAAEFIRAFRGACEDQ